MPCYVLVCFFSLVWNCLSAELSCCWALLPFQLTKCDQILDNYCGMAFARAISRLKRINDSEEKASNYRCIANINSQMAFEGLFQLIWLTFGIRSLYLSQVFWMQQSSIQGWEQTRNQITLCQPSFCWFVQIQRCWCPRELHQNRK